MTGKKAYSKPHHVHLLDCDASVVLACYQCTAKECQSTFSILDPSLASCIPESLLLSCGVQLFAQSTWSLLLLQTMFDLVSGHADMNDFVKLVWSAQTSRSLFMASQYWKDVNYFCGQEKTILCMTGHGSSAPSKFSDFPWYFQHCKGYNGTLGPSRVQCSDVYPIVVTQQLSFFNRVQGGLVATHLSADHHHHVPSRVMITDPFSGQKFSPIHGLFEVMNEKQQIIIDIWTSSTTNHEREDCAKELMTCFNERGIDMSTVVIYLDKCCDDSEWLSSLVGLNVSWTTTILSLDTMTHQMPPANHVMLNSCVR